MRTKQVTRKNVLQHILRDTEAMIYKLEFELYRARISREKAREKYSQAQSVLSELKNKEVEDKEQHEKDVEIAQLRTEWLKKVLDEQDGRIDGKPVTKEHPFEEQGIVKNLQDFVDLRDSIEDYIKKNC